MKQVGWYVWNLKDVRNDGSINSPQLVGMNEGVTEDDRKNGYRALPIYIDEHGVN